MARVINEIAVHCSATKPDQDVDAAWCRDLHVNQNGWSDIGYHWFIKRDGSIEKGREEDIQGAHVSGHNGSSIGVCLAGGIDDRGSPDANFTLEQYAALKVVLDDIRMRHPIKTIQGHRDYPDVSKACPCFDVGAWYGEL